MTVANLGRTAETSSTATAAVSPKLHTAAVQFEALLLKELIAPLTKGAEDGEDDAQGGPLQGFASDAVASSMAESGALGFAREIERTLQRRTEKFVDSGKVLSTAADK